MHKNSDLVEKFEEILEQQKARRSIRLYNSSYNENKSCVHNDCPKDIIRHISAQIKAIQNADCVVKSKNVNKDLAKYKTKSFLPVNLIQSPEVRQKKSAKFETQFVLDTQLMSVIEDVEAMNSHKGITQEFETSFDDSNIDNVNDKLKLPENIIESNSTNKDNENPLENLNNDRNCGIDDNIQNGHSVLVTHENDVNIIKDDLSVNKISLDDNCTALLDECMQVEQNINIQDVFSDVDISPSPIIKINNGNKSTNTSPLVYNLDLFEKFEKFAVPIIEENNDIDTVKHLINSQILGRELILQTDFETEPEFRTEEKHSPILKISKTPKSGIEKQDFASNKLEATAVDFFDVNKKNYGKKNKQSQQYTDMYKEQKRRITTMKNEQEIDSKNLADEILFSSDEELDINPTELKDLPFTCSLETSFYDHSDVLETNMYVGFQTASNKSIQVSSVSFSKAKSFLDDEKDIKVSTLKDLVEKCDMNPKSISDPCHDDNFKNTGGTDVHLKKSEDLDFDTTRASDTELVGFKTANGKPIDILNENIEKAKTLFSDIDKNELTKDLFQFSSKFDGFKTASNKNINLSEKAMSRCKRVFQDIDLDNDYCDKNLPSGIEPCHKRIKYSLEKDKCRNVAIEKEVHETDIPKIDEDILQEFEDEMSFNENKNCNFEGFKTASNKSIKISDIALLKSKKIFDDIDFQNMSEKNVRTDYEASCKEDNNFTKHPNVGFKTASNKIISISDEALARTKNVFQDIDISNIDSINNSTDNKNNLSEDRYTGFVGFKTASNKEIKVSESAVAKSKDIFQDIEVFEIKNSIQNKNDSNTTVLKDIYQPSTSKECFVGFKTANNNKISISEAALARTKNIFKDLDDIPDTRQKRGTKLIQDMSGNLHQNFQSSDAIKCNVNLEMENELKIEENIYINNKFTGFQTASNKPVKISNNAIVKSKIVYQGILNDISVENLDADNNKVQIPHAVLATEKNILQDSNEVTETISFHGFQTASNKKVNISTEALAKSRKIFDNLEKDNDESDESRTFNTKPFKGFQTDSNKEVKINADALAKSRKLFNDMELSIENTIDKPVISNFDFECESKDKVTSFAGFKTASNKNVKISGAALERSKMIFQDMDIIEDTEFKVVDNSTNPVFVGFQTASNKEVTVSKEALAKSKKLFEEAQKDVNVALNIKPQLNNKNYVDETSNFGGFQTAGNKKVKISAEALTKSRKTFQDLNCKENEFDLLENSKQTGFKGFKTASDKNVVISEDALSRGRQVLNDVTKNERRKDASYPTFSFKTANNNNIEISEEVLLNSKKIFIKFDKNENKNLNVDTNIKLNTHDSNVDKTEHDYNIDRLIDTQVIKNFDESLNTEDFRSPENKSKRSGSPILSCPKAKKRKFTTPYRKDSIQPTQEHLIKKIETYENDYKKNKLYTLKDLEKLENSMNISEITTDLNLDNIKIDDFEFTGKRNDISDTKLCIDMLKMQFMKVVNKKILPDGWFENHYKLILWKLLSYEIKFPKTMSGLCTAKNVLAQLKYRYFRELYNAERPALRKILERDDVASKPLILCVQDVYNYGKEKSGANQTELLLTDGWYSIRACLDKMLVKYVNDGKIRIGTKIITNGAELMNCEQGVAPWEDTSLVRLKIFGNSTRRARWDSRLGYHGDGAILSHLSDVKPDGGKVAKLRVVVTRVYPALYVEKFEDGSTVTRSERLEHIHQMKYEAERQALVEKVYEEVEKEISDVESPDTEDFDVGKRSLDSGSQIARMLKISKEPSQFMANLTDSQKRLLEAYTSSKRDRILQDIQDKIRSRVSTVGRSVVPLVKVRVAGLRSGGAHKALLSIWKPNDAVSELITEGASIEILNVVPTAIRYSELQLSAGRQTLFKQVNIKTQEYIQPYIKSLCRTCYLIKDIVKNPNMTTDYNEIDTIGMVIQIEPSHSDFKSIDQFQNVYLTDEEKNIVCVNFWGGIKKFGFENVLDTGQIVACVNLQKRAGNTRKNIPQYRATEFTYFTKTPKSVDARKLIDELSKKVLKNEDFIDNCLVVKNNLLKNVSNEKISPYRFHNHDLTKNKVYIESPLARIKNDEFSLSGLDFESTFKQTEPQELSPKSLLRKKRINERISKLEMYGEPPPLSPINIINKSKNATKSFKSPLLNSCVATTPVASEKMLPENMGHELSCSPVFSVHRSLKKAVNPVKLNFNNVAIDENDSVDHFAEDFDPSPPLSLD
ncbi:uncharacterized protein PF3D7_1120600 [Plodia interpunctella]|uniref:uncharacterized protein PF3D7_1120600 n=1 Tax=Plodia interpunctella TaxID=58824 RepID=UPI00236757B4|nr:uncharacterized protein PF3D7_1120600 [Plodia interpunctella]